MKSAEMSGNSGNRLNCNLFRAIRHNYFWYMVKYCNLCGWKYFWQDTFGRSNK